MDTDMDTDTTRTRTQYIEIPVKLQWRWNYIVGRFYREIVVKSFLTLSLIKVSFNCKAQKIRSSDNFVWSERSFVGISPTTGHSSSGRRLYMYIYRTPSDCTEVIMPHFLWLQSRLYIPHHRTTRRQLCPTISDYLQRRLYPHHLTTERWLTYVELSLIIRRAVSPPSEHTPRWLCPTKEAIFPFNRLHVGNSRKCQDVDWIN
jgi:hypothetical protein